MYDVKVDLFGALYIYFFFLVTTKGGYWVLKLNVDLYHVLGPSLRRLKSFYLYGVMQRDGNSFCGDVVLDGVNVAYRDEDKILDKICEQ